MSSQTGIPFDLKSAIAERKKEMIGLRRDFHRHPELGFKEERTAGIVAEKLKGMGLEVREGIAGTGVIGLLKAGGSSKTLLIRADMDALALTEENSTDYASLNEGAMHACGHDGHTAMLLTAADILTAHKDKLEGNIKFLFQPAEEGPGGAKPMIDDGAMEKPKVTAALAMHLCGDLPVGMVGTAPGPRSASMDQIAITIKGKGGHGAMPHQAVDALVVSGKVVDTIQTIVSREIDPVKPVVVTIGTVAGGTAFNIICHTVEMKGTVRCLDDKVRKGMPERLERIIRGVTSAMRAEYKLDYVFNYPSIVNDPVMNSHVVEAAQETVGAKNLMSPEPMMGSEDMAFFMEKVPGCYFMIGSKNEKKGFSYPHHHPRFDFDEEAMPIGVEIMIRSALKYLL
jgi:amidohydrolase